ncbi:OTU domain-containing protein 5-A-like [Schistocerca gregaria]|uniref:OTU domain-containing protein 5-A-like n=1 Tax=Schistocerca gregaria TaxID=7010 RepID=UPI00211DD218|nr:OTU domain-containing protein 5-A-like [Schistocerca gregaria]XP_049848747.1 OTU domain-containing protein 5-A-like [Schistocerca gregaria]
MVLALNLSGEQNNKNLHRRRDSESERPRLHDGESSEHYEHSCGADVNPFRELETAGTCPGGPGSETQPEGDRRGSSNSRTGSCSNTRDKLKEFSSSVYDLQSTKNFQSMLNDRGLELVFVEGDGNCLFRAIADQIYGDQHMHGIVRRDCLNYMEKERDFFADFISDDFDGYVQNKRNLGVYGDHLELHALSEMYGRHIEIFTPSGEVLRLDHGDSSARGEPPLRLSYHNEDHYNSVRDLNNPSIGAGLGLPGYIPGLADKRQLQDALRDSESTLCEDTLVEHSRAESEQQYIDEQILNSVLQSSELECVDDVIAQEYLAECCFGDEDDSA